MGPMRIIIVLSIIVIIIIIILIKIKLWLLPHLSARHSPLSCRLRLLPPSRCLLSRGSPRLSQLLGVAPRLPLRLPLLLPAFVPSVLVLFAILPT